MAHGAGTETADLAAAREEFLTAETVRTDSVRSMILASWWRSRAAKVAADHIEIPAMRDPDLDSLLAHGARPVLKRLQDQLADLPVSIILTDESGLVLERRTADGELKRYLDRVQLAPGFSYAEQHVGTNGIGTALEGLQPTAVFGHEHYAEHLDTLACAGVPIRHPASGQVIGLLDLTTWRRDAGPLLLALAKAVAEDIQQQLTTHVGVRELRLFAEYLRACRRGHGIVFAINEDLVMSNEHARKVLDPQDQAAMLGQASELVAAGKGFTHTLDLPSGAQARMSGTPVTSEAGPAGGVIRARIVRETPLPPVTRAAAQALGPQLPGLVGSGALWLRACHDVLSHHHAGEWLTVDGEPGVGKLAIIRAVHARTTPASPLTVIDFGPSDAAAWASRLAKALTVGTGTVVLRHLDQLAAPGQRDLGPRLAVAAGRQSDSGRGLWLVATAADAAGGLDRGVLRNFPGSVTVPPLRHHADDIRELVPYLLDRLNPATGVTAAPVTMQLLQRASWPGNVEQLRRVLGKVVLRRRSGTVKPEDLPPEAHTTTRRVLTPLESIERDATVRALQDAEGNKTVAAQALGMSRATIYRKIRDYGIEVAT
ncbi:MAG: sigma-54-dependent Fis family transcriptional regulator [Thermocrispum sp.]